MSEMSHYRLPEELARELNAEAEHQLTAAEDPALSEEDRAEALGLYLEVRATLAAAGEPGPAKVPMLDAGRVAATLGALSAEELCETAEETAASVTAAVGSPFNRDLLGEVGLGIEAALQERNRFDARLAGARQVCGPELELSEEQREAVAFFDELVRPLVWGASVANAAREGHARMIAPAGREGRWWWTEALDVNWGTVRSAGDVAELVERYPSFARYFDELREAARVRTRLQAGADLGAADEQAQNLAAQVRLAAASGVQEGEPRVVCELAEGAVLVLGRSVDSFTLRLMLDDASRVNGTPSMIPEGGEQRAAVEEEGSWLFVLGGELPRSFSLQCVLDGEELSRQVSLDA